MRVRVSRKAATELEEAALWYEQEEVGLGERLINAFEQAIGLLEEPNPPLVPVTHSAAESGAKQLLQTGLLQGENSTYRFDHVSGGLPNGFVFIRESRITWAHVQCDRNPNIPETGWKTMVGR